MLVAGPRRCVEGPLFPYVLLWLVKYQVRARCLTVYLLRLARYITTGVATVKPYYAAPPMMRDAPAMRMRMHRP